MPPFLWLRGITSRSCFHQSSFRSYVVAFLASETAAIFVEGARPRTSRTEKIEVFIGPAFREAPNRGLSRFGGQNSSPASVIDARRR